jgi:long-chain acyl-CoA synthetase
MNDSVTVYKTLPEYVDYWTAKCPNRIFLRDCNEGDFEEYSWQEVSGEAYALAAWLADEFGAAGARMALLSNNRAHWLMADLAIIASGNVSVPQFTTQNIETTKYILDFTEASVIFVGEADNWSALKCVLSPATVVVALPGIDPGCDHVAWADIAEKYAGARPIYRCESDELMSLVFTSGTTGLPKGVMQTHGSMIIPVARAAEAFQLRPNPRFLSYLPLSHIAERQMVWVQALIHGGEINFNESLATLQRDMVAAKPNFFFGAPRVWEQLQQRVIAAFGSQQQLDAALANDSDEVGAQVRAYLGFTEVDYLLSAAAPIPEGLVFWFAKFGISVREAYGQTEAMLLIVNFPQHSKVNSLGSALSGVQLKLSNDGELLCKAEGVATGYYRNAEKTAETFVDGWVYTGDKARIDEDGFVFLTGRLKDYFKTILGKYVAPAPIENNFALNQNIGQLCLLGRGYSKTVMVCVVSALAANKSQAELEASLLAQVAATNAGLEKHARIGAVIVTFDEWTIAKGELTPTLKIKRERVETTFGALAEALARSSAEQGRLLLEFI